MCDGLKIAVYAIARDEATHVERFMAAARDADLVCVADTGSQDETPRLLREHGAVVHNISISPWRFDDARNAALAAVPADVDVCVSLDLDEVLQPGWRGALESAWRPGTTRMKYRFVSSWNPDGSPGVTFWNDRVHARAHYRWRLPIHEVVVRYGDADEQVVVSTDFTVHHYPDESKSRADYLPLLEQAAAEASDDPRIAHYLGREYLYHQRWPDAVRELKRSLALPGSTWSAQRAEAQRMIGKALDALNRTEEATTCYWSAVHERPRQREPWVDLARALYLQGDYAGGYYAARRAVDLCEPAADYFTDPEAWGPLPHDLLSVCAWQIGLRELSLEQAERAVELGPDDERLQRNLAFLKSEVAHREEMEST